MTDQGILSEFTGSEYMFKILQEVDGGEKGRRILKSNESNASMLEEGLMESMQ